MKITRRVWEILIDHSLKKAPEEACGYLGSKDELIDTFLPLTNTDHSSEHFSLDPGEQFSASRTLRELNKSTVALFHSHPLTPARPSEEDIRLAYDPGILYVIGTLLKDGGTEWSGESGGFRFEKGSKPVIRAFWIRSGMVHEEPLEIQEEL